MQFTDTAIKGIKKRVTEYLLQHHQNLFQPFKQIAKDNGVPHANKIKLGMNCMRCIANLLKGLK
jgi:hypothetical protein